MGRMRFDTLNQPQVGNWEVECAYSAGMEGTPWRSRNTLKDGVFTVEREVADSGSLFIPWQTALLGSTVLSTASLREREEPYHLALELARGTVNRVRSQAADWTQMGLDIPASLQDQMRAATSLFVDAATVHKREPETAWSRSSEAIDLAVNTVDDLAAEYARQSLANRRLQSSKLPTLLACTLDDLPENPEIQELVTDSFNSALIGIRWKDVEPNAGEYCWDSVDRQIQWCQANGLRICAGPLLRLDHFSTPDWIYLWEDDFDQLASLLIQFITNAVNRYRGKVHLWQASARLNVTSNISLSEEQRLRLAVGSVEAIRKLDPQTPTVVSFDQPWGEYLSKNDMELSPLQFADTMIRADLGTAGLGLEMNLGYCPGGSLPRNLLEISRQIDRWSMLGLPLLVVLSCPHDVSEDPRADPKIRTVASENMQARISHLVELLLAKPVVHGIIWNQLADANLHEFPHSGLFDSDFKPKPILSDLREIRRELLM